jgi:beta-lactamase class D
MTMDRREFTGTMLLATGAAALGIPNAAEAVRATGDVAATLLVDAASGRVVHRSGACATRFAPCSSFKISLALMGYDAGILTDAHHPAWDYHPEYAAARAIDRQRTDPTSWEANSVVWYSREITKRLGMARFQGYVDRFGYGNRDLSGTPGKGDGLRSAWLGTSLMVSPDEQVAFLRRMLAHRLVSPAAHRRAEAIIPVFEGSGGWRVTGKTGSGGDETAPLGWFVGWAERGERRLAFARLQSGPALRGGPGGLQVRKALLGEISRLAG